VRYPVDSAGARTDPAARALVRGNVDRKHDAPGSPWAQICGRRGADQGDHTGNEGVIRSADCDAHGVSRLMPTGNMDQVVVPLDNVD
jgi:hypothetical protein